MNLEGPLHQYGYALVFAVLFVESLGVPSPSEITLVTAGVLAGRGQISAPAVILVGAAGSLLGALVAYTIGRNGGRRLLLRYGGRVGLTDARLAGVEGFFNRWGPWAVVVGRIISGIRAVISYPAGFFRMPFVAFVLATALGALLWPILAVEIGQILGQNWKAAFDAVTAFWPWLVALVAAGGLAWFLRKRIRR